MGFLEDVAKNVGNVAGGIGQAVGNVTDVVGTALNLPEMGLSEALSGGSKTSNTGRVPLASYAYNTIDGNKVAPTLYSSALSQVPQSNISTGQSTFTQPTGVGGIGDVSGTGGAGYTSADEAAFYQDQINRLNDLLGFTEKQRQSGLENIEGSYKSALDTANRTYSEQALENERAKQRGIENVGQVANQSYNNLRRLLTGANAGSSSVARDLIPYLVARSAGTQRQGVFDTSGQNARAIANARAEQEQNLLNTRNTSTQDFLSNLLQRQSDIDAELQKAIYNRAGATGQGYEQARLAAQGTADRTANRMAELSSLFDKYRPVYSNAPIPELGTYTVDRANIGTANTPAETTYYAPQLRRLRELLG